MRKIYLILFILYIIGLVILHYCEGNPKLTVSYSADIDPIFTVHDCKICHTAGITPHLDLSSYEGLMRGSDNGPVVIPGDADHSLLFLKVALESPPFGARMPLGRAPLPVSKIRLIEDWINQGAKNN